MPPFETTLPVRFSDVDHAGIVYYPVYLHYFHVGLEEFLRSRLGATGYKKLLDDDRLGFPTVRVECDFRSPLRFGDEAVVSLELARMGGKSMTFRYSARRLHDDKVAAEATIVVVITDLAKFVSVEPPESLRQLFLELAVETR